MTKNKRFHHKEDGWEIFDGENHLAYAHSGFQAEKICELLNELAEENNHLEEHLNIVRSHRNILISKNKELKTFKDKVFNSIDKTIESETQIAENIESTIKGDYVKAINRLTIIAFKNLKKELSEND